MKTFELAFRVNYFSSLLTNNQRSINYIYTYIFLELVCIQLTVII